MAPEVKGSRMHGRQVRYRDRARSEDEADRRGRKAHRHPRQRAAQLRPLQGQGVLRLHRRRAEEQGRQADPGHGDQPDARRRGQDHDHGRPRRRPQPHRQEGHELPARALARALLRRQGRRGRRRLRPGGADGGHQPPLHRRLPRHHVGAQPALGAARQPHLLGQRAGARRAPHRLAPRHGHERPGAARRSSTRSAAPPTAFRARTASTSRWPPR